MGIRQRQQVGTLPQLEILPQAVEVPTGSSPSSVIASCALGLDHSLVALETRRSNGRKETDILTSGRECITCCSPLPRAWVLTLRSCICQ